MKEERKKGRDLVGEDARRKKNKGGEGGRGERDGVCLELCIEIAGEALIEVESGDHVD